MSLRKTLSSILSYINCSHIILRPRSFYPDTAKEIAVRGKRESRTHHATMDEVLRAFAPPWKSFVAQKSWASWLLQLSPAFSPRKHKLNELENVLQ